MNEYLSVHKPIISLHSIPWSYGVLVKLGVNKTESRTDFPCKGFFLEGRERSAEPLFVKEKMKLVL